MSILGTNLTTTTSVDATKIDPYEANRIEAEKSNTIQNLNQKGKNHSIFSCGKSETGKKPELKTKELLMCFVTSLSPCEKRNGKELDRA